VSPKKRLQAKGFLCRRKYLYPRPRHFAWYQARALP
jgi:hypothetical protein